MRYERAVVFGAGGITGVAWMLGLAAGLAERGVDLAAADLLVGTSAGAAVAAQLSSGPGAATLYARQRTPSDAEQPMRQPPGMVLRQALAHAVPGSAQLRSLRSRDAMVSAIAGA